jgi:hypothetical protein
MYPGFAQARCVAGELGAIAGDGQVAQSGQGCDLPGQFSDTATQERFAPGEANFADAESDKHPDQSGHLFVAQPVRRLFEAFEPFGQAVGATQVTPIGDRHPQVVDAALE